MVCSAQFFFLSNSLIIGQFQLINSFISQSICADRLARGRLLPFSISLPAPLEPLIRTSVCESGTSPVCCLCGAEAGDRHSFNQKMWTNLARGSAAVTGGVLAAQLGYSREDGGFCKHSCAQPLLQNHKSGVCSHLAAPPSQTSPREQCQPQDIPHLAEEALASVHSIISFLGLSLSQWP